MFKEPSNKVLCKLLSPPNETHINIYKNHCDRHKKLKNRRSRCSCFIGFQAYLVFSNNDIIGPVIPSQAAPSDTHLPSCHAEVGVINYAKSKKRNLSKATLYCVRWIPSNDTNKWILSDGVPCKHCFRYALQNGITKYGVSSSHQNKIMIVPKSYIAENTKLSNGGK